VTVTVALTRLEYELAGVLAEARWKSNRKAGVTDQRRDDAQGHLQLDLTGMVAELAFAKHMNVYPDLTIEPRSGTPDFVIDGVRYDVKATHRPQGRLLATSDKKPDEVDRYVLAIVRREIVDLVGWATAGELIDPDRRLDIGHGPSYALSQEELRGMETL
jgi:hypothetical protein